ncbi:MAG: hypothetical protein ACFB2X_07975 [Rivularia sp. (in: cyanobacteria)]
MKSITVKSIIVVGLFAGTFVLAVLDDEFRHIFGDIAKVGIGGFLGQLQPGQKRIT